MQNATHYAQFTLQAIMWLVILDAFIVMWTMASVAAGDTSVQHIPFWDAQIRFIVDFIK